MGYCVEWVWNGMTKPISIFCLLRRSKFFFLNIFIKAAKKVDLNILSCSFFFSIYLLKSKINVRLKNRDEIPIQVSRLQSWSGRYR